MGSIVELKNLPFGFEEPAIKDYCEQFGDVKNVFLHFNRVGKSIGKGYVEFLHPEVAAVFAESMDKYYLNNRLISAKVVPINKEKKWLFGNLAYNRSLVAANVHNQDKKRAFRHSKNLNVKQIAQHVIKMRQLIPDLKAINPYVQITGVINYEDASDLY